MDWTPIILTFKLALVTTLLLLLIAIPIAYWMSETKSRFRPIIEALIAMPLVLPPTVIGFYLLIAFSPNYILGGWLQSVGLHLAFTFEGLVLASIIYSLPFMVQPIYSGLTHLPPSLAEASHILGKSKFETLRNVLLPNIKGPLLTGLVLTFAHTIGEFGVVLMIGGNIPGKTKVASIAVYDAVETMNYGLANSYSLFLFAVTFMILVAVYFLNGTYFNRLW